MLYLFSSHGKKKVAYLVRSDETVETLDSLFLFLLGVNIVFALQLPLVSEQDSEIRGGELTTLTPPPRFLLERRMLRRFLSPFHSSSTFSTRR